MGLLHSKSPKKDFKPKTLKIVLLGLENAGKTSFLNYLQNNDNSGDTLPTVGFNIGETFKFEKKGLIFDIGGKSCSLWKHYIKDANVVIFIIDVSDFERKTKLKEEVLNLAYTIDRNSQLVFLLNKIDLKEDYFIGEFVEEFKVDQLFYNDLFVDRISVVKGVGLERLIRKLSGFLKFTKIVI